MSFERQRLRMQSDALQKAERCQARALEVHNRMESISDEASARQAAAVAGLAEQARAATALLEEQLRVNDDVAAHLNAAREKHEEALSAKFAQVERRRRDLATSIAEQSALKRQMIQRAALLRSQIAVMMDKELLGTFGPRAEAAAAGKDGDGA